MDITEQARQAIEAAIPGAVATVSGGGGHFEIHVVSAEFAGKRILQKQRMVYMAIKDLMSGDAAPIHAVDKLTCETP